MSRGCHRVTSAREPADVLSTSFSDLGVATMWAKVIDHTRCIGCHACTTACKSENQVPLSVNRTYVKYVDVGTFPHTRRAFQVTRCNQCEDAPCVTACPTAAMYQRADGIVDFDKSICIGCKACMAACPYDAIFINPEDHAAEKCNFCTHRVDVGLEPACVVVCPTEAILIGDLNDSASRVAEIVKQEAVSVRRPEKETRPKLFYKGAHQATLDPLAAVRPRNGLYMWSEQPDGGEYVPSGHPERANSSAAALLSYDVPHRIPWDWRVSLYLWTKGVASGVYLVAALAVLFGAVPENAWLWQWFAPLLSAAFVAITGVLLVWDLEHPERFYYIFTKPQPKSWLVKGGVIIAAYSVALAAHLAGSVIGSFEIQRVAMIVGVPLAILTAVYTAYLFAQAKARDLWQSPLLPPHFFVQSVMAGAAAVLLGAWWTDSASTRWIVWVLSTACVVHLLLVWGEATLTHSTAHARLAMSEMTTGRYRAYFWTGVALMGAAAAAPWLGAIAAVLALIALLAHEHAYVQAGQSVPLA